jgi:cytosine/adenosine deaminase-related metal-dependent hydrolase
MNRRDFLGTLGAASATSLLSRDAVRAAPSAQASGQALTRAAQPAAARRNTVIRNAYVITMDPMLGDVAGGDVHFRDGAIVAVGRRLNAPGADEIDGRNTIVTPGFVDTHWHMWNGVLRGMTQTPMEYFALQRLAEFYTPQDHYTSVLFAAAEAINAGVTTMHDWAHGVRSPAAAEAEIQALSDAGVRARFGCGNLQLTAAGGRELPRLQQFAASRGDGRITVGVVTQNAPTFADEVRAARQAGVQTIGTHVGNLESQPELLGPDVIVTHGGSFTPAFMKLIASTGMKMALCPTTDLLMGMGLPPVHELLEAGVREADIGVSVDVTCQTSVDPFQMMRIALGMARNKAAQPTRLTPRQVLGMATRNGANILGLAGETGSLAPGKRADLVMLRTSDLNMLPASDVNATFLLVLGAQPANVDTVVIDGRIVKRAGRLTALDTAKVVGDATALQAKLRVAGKVPPVDLAT